jgi:hypothetical protein
MEMTLDHLAKAGEVGVALPYGFDGRTIVVGAYLGFQTPLHLSWDIDAVDPTIAPSTGTTVPGGLSYRCAID